jgi:hypothetical protein
MIRLLCLTLVMVVIGVPLSLLSAIVVIKAL